MAERFAGGLLQRFVPEFVFDHLLELHAKALQQGFSVWITGCGLYSAPNWRETTLRRYLSKRRKQRHWRTNLLLQFQGMIAEYERAQNLGTIPRRGKRHRALQGVINVLSGAPYGYRYILEKANTRRPLTRLSTLRPLWSA